MTSLGVTDVRSLRRDGAAADGGGRLDPVPAVGVPAPWRPRSPAPAVLLGRAWRLPAARWVVVAIVAAVTAADQGSKWWAWRATSVTIDAGGGLLVGSGVGSWFANPTGGALLDVIDALGLLLVFSALLRRARTPASVVTAGLFCAGWLSNFLDRVGLHDWTTPGRPRGVVDFIRVGNQTSNVADVCIAAGGVGLAVLACRWLHCGWRRPLDPAVLVEPDLST